MGPWFVLFMLHGQCLYEVEIFQILIWTLTLSKANVQTCDASCAARRLHGLLWFCNQIKATICQLIEIAGLIQRRFIQQQYWYLFRLRYLSSWLICYEVFVFQGMALVVLTALFILFFTWDNLIVKLHSKLNSCGIAIIRHKIFRFRIFDRFKAIWTHW